MRQAAERRLSSLRAGDAARLEMAHFHLQSMASLDQFLPGQFIRPGCGPFNQVGDAVSLFQELPLFRGRQQPVGEAGGDGLLHPFVPFETFGDPKTLNCDRDSQGDVYFADMGLSVVRPHCLDHLEDGLLPQKWMGQRIHPIQSWGGCDVDYEWQMPLVEFWLRQHGIGETSR